MRLIDGNILLISVPDEETLSRGMLSAVNLMTELKEKYALEYVITINSEPYFNQTKGKAIYYEGVRRKNNASSLC